MFCKVSELKEYTAYKYRYWLLLAICIASRMLTSIYYVEDPDSLHFALAATDFDISRFQPHFPGYPVFCFLLQVFTVMLGKFSLAFSLLGGLSIFVIIYSSIRISQSIFPNTNALYVGALLFFNPFMWLMSNRYMPDMMGTAVLMYAIWLYVRGGQRDSIIFQFVAGILAGVRLSVLPFLLLPCLLLLMKKDKKGLQILAGTLGVLIWFIPMLLDTGWEQLLASAQFQTEGHFNEWGGTVYEEPSYADRFIALIESIWAHGLGGYWQGRGVIAIIISIGLLDGLGFAMLAIKSLKDKKVFWVLLSSVLVYLCWVFFFQNILHKPRHILQVVPFVIMAVAIGYSYLSERWQLVAHISFYVLIVATGYMTYVLVSQHQQPSAIAQAMAFLQDKEGATVVSIPLVNEYMQKQGIKARFLSAETEQKLISQQLSSGEPYYVIGEFDMINTSPENSHAFYHNPYVNKMWPVIVVHEYRGGGNGE